MKNFYAVEHPHGHDAYLEAFRSDPSGDLAGARLYNFKTRQQRDAWVKVRGGVARRNEAHWRQVVTKDHPMMRRHYREKAHKALFQET